MGRLADLDADCRVRREPFRLRNGAEDLAERIQIADLGENYLKRTLPVAA